MPHPFDSLASSLKGELFRDIKTRIAYATDASVYRELPQAVVYPSDEQDLVTLVRFSNEHRIPLIPRAGGTSLAGQVVGAGIVMDVTRQMNRILEFNPDERYVWVQPGVILDELNAFLSVYGLFFGPETSTANRCTLGGMLGNNACGLRSLVYGSTRDHTLSVRSVLSNGSICEFGEIGLSDLESKCSLQSLEGDIYREIREILSDPVNQTEIRTGYPDPSVPRRNSGYALDLILETNPFTGNGKPLNLSKLLGGSEGTLAVFTAIKLNLVPLPPPFRALLCAHFSTLVDSIEANLVALENHPTAVELMDDVVLECTLSNHTQLPNRFFVEGRPKTILIIEFACESEEELNRRLDSTVASMRKRGLGYAFPVVTGKDMKKVWDLRKAGLGLLANIPGDPKSVTIIEDTAVPVKRQTEYILEMEELFARFGKKCVYHAHVGTGELHLRPVLNLKDPADVVLFRKIAEETVRIVKKYKGSFSGEHGDGRLRTAFIPELLGDHNYTLIQRVKRVFDPLELFNPGKITNPVPMDSFLRTTPGVATPEVITHYDFSADLGVVRAVEKCNGSGDCRKPHTRGGTMCPSYQATLDEMNTTRARANILREYLYAQPGKNRFDHPEIYEILDLCLSCKACKSECPSSVDMAKLKGEFLQHWYDAHGTPLRVRLIANLPVLYRVLNPLAPLVNGFLGIDWLSRLFKQLAGFHPDRSIPRFSGKRSGDWNRVLTINPSAEVVRGEVFLFLDEFTEYQDAEIGIKSIQLLTRLGYRVRLIKGLVSARTYISKGLLRKARKIIRTNIISLGDKITPETPLVGIEPSAILGFRDEYPDLAGEDLRQDARRIGEHSLLFEEFLEREIREGRISRNQFTDKPATILLHGHCQQKAVASTSPTLAVLNFPINYQCVEIPSGCCGMAGSFGYEKEHFDLSQKVGDLVLFPAIKGADENTLVCAPGTSCRHHIKDATGKRALHPVEVLIEALSDR